MDTGIEPGTKTLNCKGAIRSQNSEIPEEGVLIRLLDSMMVDTSDFISGFLRKRNPGVLQYPLSSEQATSLSTKLNAADDLGIPMATNLKFYNFLSTPSGTSQRPRRETKQHQHSAFHRRSAL